MNRLTKSFYKQPATLVAPMLISKILCTNVNGEIKRNRIIETEAYYGEEDTACHAHKGKTNRTKLLYEEGGVTYIYLCYGIHNLLNVVTGPKYHPEAVLIRGIEGYDGPGKLTKYLNIDRSLNGVSLLSSEKIWIECDGVTSKYSSSKRIGIDYATKEYREKLWRFVSQG